MGSEMSGKSSELIDGWELIGLVTVNGSVSEMMPKLFVIFLVCRLIKLSFLPHEFYIISSFVIIYA